MSDAQLIIRSAGSTDAEAKLSGSASIGRAFDNSIRIDAKGVSRYHAIIEERNGLFWLSDLGSRNGTSVNGAPVTSECKLQDGDLISLGGTIILEYRFGESGTPATVSEASTTPTPSAVSPSAPPAAAQSSGQLQRVILSLAIGLVIVGIVALVLVGVTGSKSDPGTVRIISPESGAIISEPALVRINAEKPGNIARVIYQLDGIEFATAVMPPEYEAVLDLEALKQRGMVSDGSPKLSVVIEDKKGGRKTVPETVLLSWNLKERDGGRQTRSPGVDVPGPGPSVEARALASDLAFHISQKRDYTFSPDFIAQVERYTSDYLSASVNEQNRREIARQFDTIQGLPSLLGLVLAMKQSVSREEASSAGVMDKDQRVGLFRLPKSIAKDYISPDEPDSALNDPKRSIQIAARYTKDLVDRFHFRTDDFIYVVACFGIPINEAGELSKKLEETAPDQAARRDFWRMVKFGVIDSAAANRAVRFFAAGIVGENPQKFRLAAKPLNSL
jgi:pSer/pThr/pTyr-binding forkhead associated (FHA) protein